jgi:hypothetical protein
LAKRRRRRAKRRKTVALTSCWYLKARLTKNRDRRELLAARDEARINLTIGLSGITRGARFFVVTRGEK